MICSADSVDDKGFFDLVTSEAELGAYDVDLLSTKVKEVAIRAASLLVDPACKVHECWRRISLVKDLNPTANKVSLYARKILLAIAIVGFATLALFATIPGIALHFLIVKCQTENYLHKVAHAKPKNLGSDGQFTLLSWNICCVGGGYSISDGGVLPWHFRINAIADKIIEKDADVNCIYETNDTDSAFLLMDRLKDHGYVHFYFNIGAQGFGPSSGMMVASKYHITDAEYIPFSQDMLVGRTKLGSKGVFAFDIQSNGASFARIFTTHLQHSEEPQHATPDEVQARRAQMLLIVEKVQKVKDKCVVVTGDLNLDDDEYAASEWSQLFTRGERNFGDPPGYTWGGDEYCARLVGDKLVSGPLNLDHTLLLNGTAESVLSQLVETGYDASKLIPDALSDHAGVFSTIALTA